MGRENYIELYGVPQVNFIEADSGLRVNIKTHRLELTSVTMEDLDNYHTHLFGNPQIMEKYGNTQIWDKKKVKTTIEKWMNRWNGKNPFSGLVVQSHQGAFLGHVILGEGDEPYDSELACLIRKEAWGKRYGSEALGAIVLFYAPELVKKGYKIPQQAAFKRIVATARPDNKASGKILEKLGFTVYKQSEKYGHKRDHYALAVAALK